MTIIFINNDPLKFDSYNIAVSELTQLKENEIINGNIKLAGHLCLEIAECYYRLNNYAKLKEEFNEAILFYNLTNHKLGKIDASLRWAKYLRFNAEYDKSQYYFNIALSQAKENKYQKGYLDAKCGIAENERILGKYQIALASHFWLLHEFTKIHNSTGLIWALLGIGQIYRTTFQFEKSIEYYTYALKQCEAIGDTKNLGFALKGLGEVYTIKNKSYHSIDLLYSAIKHFEISDYKIGLGYTHKTLADSLLALGFIEEAEEESLKSSDIFTKVNDERGLNYSKKGFADIIYQKGELAKSLIYYQECNRFFYKHNIFYGLSQTQQMVDKIETKLKK